MADSAQEKKPLFNRSYLKFLVLGIVVAVLYLSSLGLREPSYATIYKNTVGSAYWMPTRNDENRLQILLDTGLALTAQAHLERDLWQELLSEQLAQHWADYTPSVARHTGFLALTLIWPEDGTAPDYLRLIANLRSLDLTPQRDAWQALQAKRYLRLQAPEERLVSEFEALLSGYNPSPDFNRVEQAYSELWFDYALALDGPDVAEQAAAWGLDQGEQSAPRLGSTALDARGSKTLNVKGQISFQATGHRLGPYDLETLVHTQIAFHTIDKALATVNKARLNYRLLNRTGRNDGYQAILLSQQGKEINPEVLLQARNLITPAWIEETAQKLRETFDQRFHKVSDQAQQLASIAFYAESVDSLKNRRKLLNEPDTEAVLKLVQAALDPQAPVRVTMVPF